MTSKKARPRFFDRVKAGLEEIILHAEGKIKLKTYVMADAPPAFTKNDVVALRNRLQATQLAFARLLNVPVSTVRLWEAGKRKPSGSAARLIQVYANRPEVVEFVTKNSNG